MDHLVLHVEAITRIQDIKRTALQRAERRTAGGTSACEQVASRAPAHR